METPSTKDLRYYICVTISCLLLAGKYWIKHVINNHLTRPVYIITVGQPDHPRNPAQFNTYVTVNIMESLSWEINPIPAVQSNQRRIDSLGYQHGRYERESLNEQALHITSTYV